MDDAYLFAIRAQIPNRKVVPAAGTNLADVDGTTALELELQADRKTKQLT